ncbi:MAG: GNAT family N-acetyltransferase [Bacteroidales bacterium]
MNTKQQYIDYCNKNSDIVPLFMQPWYLDIVCKKDWNATIFCKNNEPIALLPYYIHKQHFFKSVRPTMFMPYQGLVLDKQYLINHPQILKNNHSKFHFENEISEFFAQTIDNMNISACFLKIIPQFFCATPFIQHSFKANIQYTYILDITNDNFLDGFSPVMRKKIRKAEKELTIIQNYNDLEYIYSILETTYSRQNKTIPYYFDLFSEIVTTSIQRNQGKIFVCLDKLQNICSVLFIAWDNNTAYSLIGGSNYNNIQRDGGAFTQFASINYAHSIGLSTYDFEGSMYKGIEEFFQHFGGKRTPFMSLTKYYSKIYQHLRSIKQR